MKIVIDIPNSLYANLKKIQNGSIACKRILELVRNATPYEERPQVGTLGCGTGEYNKANSAK